MSDHPLTTQQSPRALLLIGLLNAVFFAVNPQIIADWRAYSFDDGTYSHAYLIPFMCAYVAYIGWRQHSLPVRWSWLFFGLTVLTLLAYQWLEFAHQRYLSRILVPAGLTFALLTVLRLNRFVLAIGGFFWFVTPVWGPINEFLQWSSVRAVNYLMSFTGIPTFVYDEFVQIPAGTFEIADGCSGMRYVIAALALVGFYSVLYLKRLHSALLLIALAIFGAMLTNWLRIVALILIGHFSDMQADIINDHNMFGWFLFIPLMFLLFFLADRLENGESNQSPAANPESNAKRSSVQLPLLLTALLLCSGVTVRLVAGLPIYVLSEFNVEGAVALDLPTHPAPKIYALSSYDLAAPGEEPQSSTRYYLKFDGGTDAERAEFYLNDPVPNDWRIINERRTDSTSILEVAKGSKRAVIEYSYRVGMTETGNRGALRLARLTAALEFDRSSYLRWTFTRCTTDCQIGASDAP